MNESKSSLTISLQPPCLSSLSNDSLAWTRGRHPRGVQDETRGLEAPNTHERPSPPHRRQVQNTEAARWRGRLPGSGRRGVLSVKCAQALLVSLCCLFRTPLRWSKARRMVHPLQVPSSLAHSTHSLGTSQTPSTAQHSTTDTMWSLPSRTAHRRQMSQVPSRTKYGLRLRYKPESRVRVDSYGSISADPICAGKGFSERVH